MKRLDKKNLEFILLGSTLLGSGGGGEIKTGKKFIQVILKQKYQVKLIDKPSDKLAFVLADIGAVTEIETDQELAIYNAYDKLNDYFKAKYQKECSCLFPVETGPENTLAAIVAAAKKQVDVYDGDGAGRAVPQIQLCSYAQAGVAPAPSAITNDKNDSLLVFCENPADMDSLLRPITAADQFGNSASITFFPASAKTLAKSCVQGSISFALYTGMLIKGLIRKHDKMIAKAMPVVNTKKASLLGYGKVVDVTQKVQGAFDIGSTTIQVSKGNTITIYNQNENIIAFSSSSSSPITVAPHSICFMKKNFNPITNAEIKKNDFVYIISIEAAPQLQKKKVLAGFQTLLKGLGYAGKIDFIYQKDKVQPLGILLKSLANT